MSKSERAEYPESNVGQEDVPRFENYEKHGKTKYFEKLKKKDIMNYIEDIKQKCHLEVTSDDEDCTGARKRRKNSLSIATSLILAIIAARQKNLIRITILIMYEKILRKI
ncbi:hypothetical protein PUN28_001773 [Cardiocondyla obscurior]|uniref:Uncharacterized protein n=1 Tax=Cardiocondyla obscurior TaxID=286306 RepID=A0AAW2GR72_9HYME